MAVISAAPEQIRAFRLQVHNLEQKLPFSALTQAAGVCGFQNSPPDSWETAAFCRLTDCTRSRLHEALYAEKSLLQAWSYRGVPLIFPTKESDAFLTSLIPLAGETPWTYTLGLSGALSFFDMSFDELLPPVCEAIRCLEHTLVHSKETLDRTVAEQVRPLLPSKQQALWDAPSIYGDPARQTMGQAAVSFLLRPCSHLSLVVFGERQKNSPTFTSYRGWVGPEADFLSTPHDSPKKPGLGEYPLKAASDRLQEAGLALVKKFVHAFGPASCGDFAKWAGCPARQAKRLWNMVAGEFQPVTVDGKTRYLLKEDTDRLLHAQTDPARLCLLGAHDPYLDLRDRAVILPETGRQRLVWKTVANPHVILRGGLVVGIWTVRTQNAKIRIDMTLWDALSASEQAILRKWAERYAGFREIALQSVEIHS